MKNLTYLLSKVSVAFLMLFVVTSCNEKEVKTPPPPEITVVDVLQKDVPIYSEFVGQVYGLSDIPIRARVSGYLEGIHFDEGFAVEKGQLLYSVDPEQYQSKVSTQESHLAEAVTELAKTKSDLDRIKPLAEINAVSNSDLDAAQANYDAALSYVEAQKSNLEYALINLSYCKIKSPLDGMIGKTKARVGEFVGQDPNPVILNTVSTLDSVRVEFYISEGKYITLAREYSKVREFDKKKKQDKKPDIKLILADGSTFNYRGYVNFINREVDPQTGSILIQTTFPNPENLLKPGQYSKVVIKMKEIKGGLLIPIRCTMELQGQLSVYVVNSDNVVENRQITPGETVGDMILVSEGIKAGEKVVIDAMQKVSSGSTVVPKLIVFESQTNSKN